MSKRKASMGDKVYRGDVIKYIRNNISLDTFMKRTVQKADEACWDLCDKLNFVSAIEEAPTIEPERKTGKWIDKWHNGSRYCDQCGAVLEGDYWYWRNNYYCYHCGAKMEIKDE